MSNVAIIVLCVHLIAFEFIYLTTTTPLPLTPSPQAIYERIQFITFNDSTGGTFKSFSAELLLLWFNLINEMEVFSFFAASSSLHSNCLMLHMSLWLWVIQQLQCGRNGPTVWVSSASSHQVPHALSFQLKSVVIHLVGNWFTEQPRKLQENSWKNSRKITKILTM